MREFPRQIGKRIKQRENENSLSKNENPTLYDEKFCYHKIHWDIYFFYSLPFDRQC